MSDREKLAREWAEDYQKNYPELAPETQAAELVKRAKAAAEYIMATTSPPTMADVEWDDEKHYLAGAVCEVEGAREVVAMVSPRHDGQILCLNAEVSGAWLTPLPSDLTPNGKRYELREVSEPGHPEVLETVEDYQNAPEGTIVVTPGEDSVAVQKLDDGKWGIIGFKRLVDAEDCSSASADHGATTVLRWGDGA